MKHPFADTIGLQIDEIAAGSSRCSLVVDAERHLNPHGVVHGSVMHALADTGMGAAIYPTLNDGESCTTIETKMSYFSSAREGELHCDTRILKRGRSVAYLESSIYAGEKILAHATGSYAILQPKPQN